MAGTAGVGYLTSSSEGRGREVSESAFEYLLSELLASAMAVPPPNKQRGEAEGGGERSSSSEGGGSDAAAALERLDMLGYEVGFRFVERSVTNQKYIGAEPLDLVKFLCKEFWEEVFRKKIDKLQTNHRGVFVLTDVKFKWLEKYAGADDMSSKQAAAKMLHFPCGILKGALANLGISAVVNADFNVLPGVTFNIRVSQTSQKN